MNRIVKNCRGITNTQCTDRPPPIRPSSLSPWIDSCPAYLPRKDDRGISWFLDANEGRPLASVIEALVMALSESPSSINRYPSFVELEVAIAGRWKIDPLRVVVTAGGDDAIGRICAARLAPGSSILVHEPAFEMFGVYARSRGAGVLSIPWLDGDDFPLKRTISTIQADESIGLVTLVSPSNPTGGVVSLDEALSLAKACAECGVALLFDAAYGEFADVDPSPALVEGGLAYVVRSFSKAFGMAGMRLGYALAPSAESALALRSSGMPYPSSSLASLAALTALADVEGLRQTITRARLERAALSQCLRGLGAKVNKSGANFVLARVGDPAGLASSLLADGIAIRSYKEREPLKDAVRITCPGDDTGLSLLVEAIKRAREYIQ